MVERRQCRSLRAVILRDKPPKLVIGQPKTPTGGIAWTPDGKRLILCGVKDENSSIRNPCDS